MFFATTYWIKRLNGISVWSYEKGVLKSIKDALFAQCRGVNPLIADLFTQWIRGEESVGKGAKPLIDDLFT